MALSDDNTTDDVWYGRENNLGTYNVYIGQCGDDADPIPVELVPIYDAFALQDEADFQQNCNVDGGNGNSCRAAIKSLIKSQRNKGWENDPLLSTSLDPNVQRHQIDLTIIIFAFSSSWNFHH